MSRRADTALKQLVAAEYSNGTGITELAARHGYTTNGMSRLVRSQEVQAIIAADRERVLQASERSMFRYISNLDSLSEMMITTALDPSNPKAFEANKWIQERVVASRVTQEVNVNFNVNKEVVLDLHKALEGVREVHAVASTAVPAQTHLQEGRNALPPTTVDLEDIDDSQEIKVVSHEGMPSLERHLDPE